VVGDLLLHFLSLSSVNLHFLAPTQVAGPVRTPKFLLQAVVFVISSFICIPQFVFLSCLGIDSPCS